MKLNVLIFLFLLREDFCYKYSAKYINVPLDHFSFTTNATFKLKYLINDEHWIKGGPIFIYTGNEGPVEMFADNTGFMFDIAPTFNALLIFAEHRYYGESLPFGNSSYDNPKKSGYLSTSQALADYVYLINYLQKHKVGSSNSNKVPVVAFGGSYGGMLAAWIRMKYPASVIGAIASSAPIWAFTVPSNSAYRIVTDVYRNSAEGDCSVPVKKSWKAIRNMISTDAGKVWLSSEWKLCNLIKTTEDVKYVLGWYHSKLFNTAMANYPYPNTFLGSLPAFPVKTFCSKLLEHTFVDDKSLLRSIGSALEVYTNYTLSTKCNNIHENMFGSGWNFQTCTELMEPIYSDENDFFENRAWNFTEYNEQCAETWGVKMTSAEWLVLQYGGQDLRAASNIVFSNGLLDPWSSGGVLSNISETVTVVIIPEGAHHLDLRGANPADPQSVKEARKFQINSIRKWIAEY